MPQELAAWAENVRVAWNVPFSQCVIWPVVAWVLYVHATPFLRGGGAHHSLESYFFLSFQDPPPSMGRERYSANKTSPTPHALSLVPSLFRTELFTFERLNSEIGTWLVWSQYFILDFFLTRGITSLYTICSPIVVRMDMPNPTHSITNSPEKCLMPICNVC